MELLISGHQWTCRFEVSGIAYVFKLMLIRTMESVLCIAHVGNSGVSVGVHCIKQATYLLYTCKFSMHVLVYTLIARYMYLNKYVCLCACVPTHTCIRVPVCSSSICVSPPRHSSHSLPLYWLCWRPWLLLVSRSGTPKSPILSWTTVGQTTLGETHMATTPVNALRAS